MEKIIRIVFVWPFGFERRYLLPISIGYLKSNLPEHLNDVHCVDCTLEAQTAGSDWYRARIAALRPDVLCVSAWSVNFPEALHAIQVAKDVCPSAVTVFGGPHATSNFSEVMMKHPEIDFLLTGEAESALALLIHKLSERSRVEDFHIPGLAYRKEGLVHHTPTVITTNIDAIRPPDFNFIRLKTYWDKGYRLQSRSRRNAPIWVTRGCPYRCTFCSAPMLNGRSIRAHSIDYMREWILDLHHRHGVNWFNIIDDNFTFNLDYAKNFCRMVIALNLDIRFGTPNGVRVQRGDAELWRLMKDAGWRTLIIAPESASARTLKRMKKNLDPSIIPPAIKEIRRAGLKVHGLFLIGYPGDTFQDLALTRDFILKCDFDFIYINVFQPLPGTPIHNELLATGEISADLVPKSYSEGTRSYVTRDLIGLNFPGFVLKTYLLFALRRPSGVLNIFMMYDIGFLARKIIRNVRGLFSRSATMPVVEN